VVSHEPDRLGRKCHPAPIDPGQTNSLVETLFKMTLLENWGRYTLAVCTIESRSLV
jgi:hypothetical protein